MERYRAIGVPPKQKTSLFEVSDNALIKPGNFYAVEGLEYNFT